MTAQEPFHDLISRAGGLTLFAVVLVPLVDDGNFLAEITRVVGVGSSRIGGRLTHGIRLRLQGRHGKGARSALSSCAFPRATACQAWHP